jgi:hypothetical protein
VPPQGQGPVRVRPREFWGGEPVGLPDGGAGQAPALEEPPWWSGPRPLTAVLAEMYAVLAEGASRRLQGWPPPAPAPEVPPEPASADDPRQADAGGLQAPAEPRPPQPRPLALPGIERFLAEHARRTAYRRPPR